MARITLSIADDAAAQLDAYAEESNLNRSQAAEFILRKFFAGEATERAPVGDDLAQQLVEVKDYLTVFHDALSGFTDQLPKPPWASPPAPATTSYIGRSLRRGRAKKS